MSALDDAVQQYRSGKQKDARAELAALRESEKYWQAQAETERANAAGQRDRAEELRAKAAEYDRIAELIDPTDCSIYDQIVYLLNDDSSDVELRATVATLMAQNAEQARRLEEASKLIMYVMPSVEPYMVTQLRAWLAANAAPQAEQEQAG